MSTRLKILLALGIPLLIVGLTELAAWDGGYFQIYYVLPLALLVPWVIILRLEPGGSGHRFLFFDAIAMALAGFRIVGPYLPMSGHVLFLVHTGLTIRNRWYRLAAAAVLAEVTYLKIFVWHEARSWIAGLVAGGLLAAVASAGARRAPGRPPTSTP